MFFSDINLDFQSSGTESRLYTKVLHNKQETELS